MQLKIERATDQDVPAIVHLVRKLAEYEKLSHAMVSREDDFRKALFGQQRTVDALMAFADETAVGFALYFYNFSTFEGRTTETTRGGAPSQETRCPVYSIIRAPLPMDFVA